MHDKVVKVPDDGVNNLSTAPYSIIKMPVIDVPTKENSLNDCSQENCQSTDLKLDLHAAVRSGNTATVQEMLQAGN